MTQGQKFVMNVFTDSEVKHSVKSFFRDINEINYNMAKFALNFRRETGLVKKSFMSISLYLVQIEKFHKNQYISNHSTWLLQLSDKERDIC